MAWNHTLKKLRTSMRLTQAQLAEQLGTTQQTVARWERGAAEPGIAKLREIALIMGVSTQYLLSGGDGRPVSNRYHMLTSDHLDGYWGNFGIRLPGISKSRWFPVTVSEMKRAYANVQSAQTFVVETLNNRCLLINRRNIEAFYFLEDAADHVEGDWDVGADDVQGEPEDFYRAIVPILEREAGIDQAYTRAYRAYCLRTFRGFGIDREDMADFVFGSRIYLRSGAVQKTWLDPQDLNGLHFDFDIGVDEQFIKVGLRHGEIDAWLSMETISVIDLSLIELRDAPGVFDE